MYPLSIKQIYLNKRDYFIGKRYHSLEWMKHEKKMHLQAQDWLIKFHKAKCSEKLEDVYYYVLPTEITNSALKASISNKGKNIRKLSSSRSSDQNSIFVLFPQDKFLPKDFALIRLSDPIKYFLSFSPGSKNGDYIINVENFEHIQTPYLLGKNDLEKNRVRKFITENLITTNKWDALSFQTPISSAPISSKGFGGIASTGQQIDQRHGFSDEFLSTLKMMLPPEFTNIKNKYPLKLINGIWEADVGFSGIKFNLSENYPIINNYYSSIVSNNSHMLDLELIKKKSFEGEYSITCIFNSNAITSREKLREILSRFVKTETATPLKIGEIEDVSSYQVQKEINEDLRVQIAHQRKIMPIVNLTDSYLESLRKNLINDWKVIFEQFNVKSKIENETKIYAKKTFDNILKLSQSLARDRGITNANLCLTEAYDLFTNNSLKMAEYFYRPGGEFEQVEYLVENEQTNSLMTELSIKPMNLQELFESVGHLFKNNLILLQKYLDDLKMSGRIWEPREGFYKWLEGKL